MLNRYIRIIIQILDTFMANMGARDLNPFNTLLPVVYTLFRFGLPWAIARIARNLLPNITEIWQQIVPHLSAFLPDAVGLFVAFLVCQYLIFDHPETVRDFIDWVKSVLAEKKPFIQGFDASSPTDDLERPLPSDAVENHPQHQPTQKKPNSTSKEYYLSGALWVATIIGWAYWR